MYDCVEVVRGATVLMTGAGSPAATLNLVRK
jgi:outer membrane receptor for ferric coprogen and ferric-rhodotorulic acid